MQVPVVVGLMSPDHRVKYFDDSLLCVGADREECEGGHGQVRTYLSMGGENWCLVCVGEMLSKGTIRSISAPFSAYTPLAPRLDDPAVTAALLAIPTQAEIEEGD